MRRIHAKLAGTFLVCALLWLGAFGVLHVSAAPAAATYYVDPAGNDGNACTAPGAAACQSIGGALGKAADGDSISVAAAVYHEHLTIAKSVTVTGAAMTSTIIDGSKTQRVLTVTAGASVVLNSLSVRNGKTPFNGGGIFNDASLTLKNVAVITNTAGNSGGGIYSSHALLLVNSSVLTNSATNGGGIENFGQPLQVASVTLSNSVVSANRAAGDGGGLHSSHNLSILGGHSFATVQTTMFDANQINGSGAGIYNNGSLAVSTSRIQRNRSNSVNSADGGGGLYIEAGLVTVTLSSFYANSVYAGHGGGIYNYSATLTLTGTDFLLDSSVYGGGLALGQWATTGATNGDYSQNVAFYGGAVDNGGYLVMSGARLHDNRGDVQGGAVRDTNYLILSGSTVTNNEARDPASGGGGLYLSGGGAIVDNTTVSGNHADYTYTVSGGGIYLDAGSSLNLTNSHVDNNSVGYLGYGGGIAAYTSTILLANSTLDDNRANAAGRGGGLYLLNTSASLSALDISRNVGVYAGGGIESEDSPFTLTNSVIDDNHASAAGGGIYAFHGTLSLSNSALSGNQSDSDGGGIDLYDVAANLTNATLNNNLAQGNGGGIKVYLNRLAFISVTVDGNRADNGAGLGNGGGLYVDNASVVGEASTLSDNHAGRRGGGLFNTSRGASSLTNVTLSANGAITGGAIYNDLGITGPTLVTLTNVTLKDNAATDGGGFYNGNHANTFAFLKNTLLADSPTGGNCKGKAFAAAQYSLSTDGTCVLVGLGNQTGAPALLNPLANNGGPTWTHLPKPASPAVDGVGGNDCPSDDQRGAGRPQGNSCDIGAVERQPTDPALSPGLYLPVVVR